MKKYLVCGVMLTMGAVLGISAQAQSNTEMTLNRVAEMMDQAKDGEIKKKTEANNERVAASQPSDDTSHTNMRDQYISGSTVLAPVELGRLRRYIVEGYYSKRVENTGCGEITTVRDRNLKYIRIKPTC